MQEPVQNSMHILMEWKLAKKGAFLTETVVISESKKILHLIIFFCPIEQSMGIVKMESKIIFDVHTFFK